jgi:4-alpha-glucanotransferase
MPEHSKAPTRVLRMVARACGILVSYIDYKGDRVYAPDSTLAQLIGLLRDIPPADISPGLLRIIRSERRQRGLPAVIVAWDGHFPPAWMWTTDKPDNLSVTLTDECGRNPAIPVEISTDNVIRRSNGYRVRLRCSGEIPFGYYNVKAGEKTCLLISAPSRITSSEKSWGLFVPAYALRSKETQGLGGYRDLREAAAFVRRQGGGFMGTLPLLPVFYDGPDADPSPYAPVSRLFWNEIFLDVTDLPGVPKPADDELRACNGDDLVDYKKIYALKKNILQKSANQFFSNAPDGDEGFKAYEADSPQLQAYADFHAARAPAREKEAVRRYHLYAQYACHRQMAALKDAAESGQAAELYIDYTVGVHASGFDATAFSNLFMKGARAGAPPDLYFSHGQNWGFYPFHPRALETERFSYVRAALHHYFRYARMIRLDHVIGLYRIYCIPNGESADRGAFVRRPFEALLAILCLEAWRHDGILIGENLGTVPPVIDEAMKKHGLHRMWAAQMEMKGDPVRTFSTIEADMIAGLNTHDMFPFESFLANRDIGELRRRDLLAEPAARKLKADREALLRRWKEMDDPFMTILKGLAASPARYVMIALEDFWKETRPQNIPGTGGWGNWRQKLAMPLEDWPRCAPLMEGLAILNRHRRRSS